MTEAGPFVTVAVGLLAWVAVVKWRYRESLTQAASIGCVAWAAVLVGLVLLTPSGSGAVLGSVIW